MHITMSINNLHSLLSGKWFIEGAYAKSLLPSLSLVLQGEIKEQTKEDITTFISASTGKTIDASVVFSEDNTADYVSIISLKSNKNSLTILLFSSPFEVRNISTFLLSSSEISLLIKP